MGVSSQGSFGFKTETQLKTQGTGSWCHKVPAGVKAVHLNQCHCQKNLSPLSSGVLHAGLLLRKDLSLDWPSSPPAVAHQPPSSAALEGRVSRGLTRSPRPESHWPALGYLPMPEPVTRTLARSVPAPPARVLHSAVVICCSKKQRTLSRHKLHILPPVHKKFLWPRPMTGT